jgi:hypothetical protein
MNRAAQACVPIQARSVSKFVIPRYNINRATCRSYCVIFTALSIMPM